MVGQIPLFPGDPILTEREARKHLNPIMSTLRSCVDGAFEFINNTAVESPTFATALDYMGARQKIVNAMVVARVHELFADVQNVEVRDVNGFAELRVDDVIDLRFKLVDEAGRSKNIETPAQKLYRNLQPLSGTGKLDVMRLTVGWRWDTAATRIEDVVVVFLKGDDPVWKFSVLDGVAASDVMRLPKQKEAAPATRYVSATRKAKETKKGG